MRIKRQSETFAYRFADSPFNPNDDRKKKPFDLSGTGLPNLSEKADLDALPEGWSAKPFNDAAEAEANRAGPKMPKIDVIPGASSGGSAGGNTARPGGGGGGSVGAEGIMDVSRPLYNLIKEKYPDVTIGGYRDDGPGMPTEHQRGSIDIMHPYNHGIDPNWVIEEGFKAGAPWAIWDNQMYYPDGRTEPYNVLPGMPDDATQRHEDHVHIGPLM